jgi:DNA-directed RNA polymerase specialized sigma24 family protein
MSTFAQSSVEKLANLCCDEQRDFKSGCPGPVGACFELFRRAIVEQSETAWAAILEQFGAQMVTWAGSGYTPAEDVTQQAMEKFLRTLTPERFAKFTGVQGPLGYLKRCVKSVRIDQQRKQIHEEQTLQRLGREGSAVTEIESSTADVLQQTAQQSLIAYIRTRLKDSQECYVLELNVVLGLKSAEVAAACPEVFTSVREVYRAKERVIRRLSQDPMLRALYETSTHRGK